MYLTRKTAVIAMAFLITVITVVSIDLLLPDANASTLRGVSTDETAQRDGIDVDNWEQTCYDGGFRDGQNKPFENEAHKECGDYGDGADRYYDGFIDGCMSVSGNTKDVCEGATDE
jgi:hypothetical protein